MEDSKAKFQADAIAPMHTAEHLLNQTMVRLYGCPRSNNAHIERKKSKISYQLENCPSDAEVEEIVSRMNALIAADLPVYEEFVEVNHLPENVTLDRLPEDAANEKTIRLIRIGDYDVCPCIGQHVQSTSQLGHFHLLGTNWDPEAHSFRIRFKLQPQ